MKNLIKLHEAIVLALVEKEDRASTFSDIASFINTRNLFPIRKGNITLEKQIMLRTTKSKGRYFHLFESVGLNSVRLRNT